MKLRSKLHMEPYLLNKYYGGSQSQIKSGVRLPGTAGNYISTPDSVLNSVTGDIDIRVFAKADDWTPTAGTTFISRWNPAPNRQFTFALDTSGKIQFGGSIDGSIATVAPFSVNPVPFADGTAGWVRVTLDVDNGSGQSQIRYYTSVDGITWTSLGDPAAGTGVISLFDSTNPIVIGSNTAAGTAANFAGTIYYAEVRNGIDGPIVAKFDVSQVQVSGATAPATINGWTWNGAALYKRDDYVRLPGSVTNYLSFPDTVSNSVTGDIDIRCHLSLDNWSAASQCVVGKWDAPANQRSYLMRVDANTIALFTSSTGSDTIAIGASAALSFANGSAGWIRATRVQSTGVTVWYSSLDGVTWTVLTTSSPVSAGVATFDSTAVLQIGAQNSGGSANPLAGNVYYAEVRNGINGPVVASFNGADNMVQTPWTINGSAWNWEGSSFTGKPGIALSLPGTSGNYASTPDTAGNSIVGDIDIRAKISADDWTPAAVQQIVNKEVPTTQRSYGLRLNTDGKLLFRYAIDGTTALQELSSAATGFADGSVHWVRVTRVSGTGTSFYISEDGVTWTPLGTIQATTAGALFDSTSPIEVGARNAANDLFAGKVFYAEVRAGIDGPIVAKFDPTNIIPTGVRLPTNTVQPGGSPNGLNPNQASIETDATGWVAGVGAPTLAQDATQFLDGTKSLSLVATAAGPAAIGAETTPVTTYPVVANKLYTARDSFRTAVTGQLCKVGIHWYTAASASISTSFGSTITDLTSGWTEAVVTALAPATAAYATVQVEVAGALITEKHFIDRISEVESAEVWTLNGSAWNWVAT